MIRKRRSDLYPGPWRSTVTITARISTFGRDHGHSNCTSTGNEKKAPLTLTAQAIAKVREIMATQDPLPAGLRIGVMAADVPAFSTPWPSRTRAA